MKNPVQAVTPQLEDVASGSTNLTPTPPLPKPPQATTKALRASAAKLAASGQAAPAQAVVASVSVSGTATPPPTGELAASPNLTPAVSGTATPSPTGELAASTNLTPAVSGTATPSPTGELAASPNLTPAVSGTATPPTTGELAASTTVSVSGTSFKPSPSPIAYFLARLQDQDIDVVEAALVKFKEACLRGDHSVVEAALIEQATLLNAVGSTLVTNVGSANTMEQKQVWASLGLRSLEMARKSLELVISSRGRRGPQTSDSAPTNDLEVPRG